MKKKSRLDQNEKQIYEKQKTWTNIRGQLADGSNLLKAKKDELKHFKR